MNWYLKVGVNHILFPTDKVSFSLHQLISRWPGEMLLLFDNNVD